MKSWSRKCWFLLWEKNHNKHYFGLPYLGGEVPRGVTGQEAGIKRTNVHEPGPKLGALNTKKNKNKNNNNENLYHGLCF